MYDVREHVTLATIMQKDVFDHNFRTEELRMTILASRYMIFKVKESDGAIFFLLMTLTFQGHDIWEITFWAISQLVILKMLLNFNTGWVGSGPFNK